MGVWTKTRDDGIPHRAHLAFLLAGNPSLTVDDLRDEFPDFTSGQIDRMIRRILRPDKGHKEKKVRRQQIDAMAERIVDAIQAPIETVGRVEKVRASAWQGMYKDADGVAHLVDMEGVQILVSPSWEEGPKWPVIQPVPETVVTSLPATTRHHPRGMKTAVFLCDPQIGFFWNEDGSLTPTHDESAMNVALQIVRDIAPDRLVCLGDNLDLTELSTKYVVTPPFAATTNAAIFRCADWLSELRANTPEDTEIDWVEGNHEKRLPTFALVNGKAALSVLRSVKFPNEPVLSFPVLCGLDDRRVNYIAGFPAGDLYLNRRLKAIHGHKAAKGVNAAAYLKDEHDSVLYGHIHRREWAEATYRVFGGSYTQVAASFGCLCRVDGAVPSVRGGVDINGRPIIAYENWQQGLGIVTYDPDGTDFFIESIAINAGTAFVRGVLYTATCDIEGRPLIREKSA